MIAKHEGCCQCTYLDSLGKPTVGIGYLLVPSRTSQMEQVGLNYEQVVSGQTELNMEQITSLFNIYVQSSIQVAQKTFSNWNSLCCNVEQALVDIIYDLNNGISAFHTFISDINSENWEGAAGALKNSLFCRQVGSRCTDDAALIAQGCSGSNKQNSQPAQNTQPAQNSNSQPQQTLQAANPDASSSQPASSQPASSQPASSQPASSQPASSQPASTEQSSQPASTQQSTQPASTEQSTQPASTQQSTQ